MNKGQSQRRYRKAGLERADEPKKAFGRYRFRVGAAHAAWIAAEIPVFCGSPHERRLNSRLQNFLKYVVFFGEGVFFLDKKV
jgi:hypothetical protein